MKCLFTFSVVFKGSQEFECLALSVHNCNSSSPGLSVVLFYRPPNSGHSPLDDLFVTLCNIFVNLSLHLYLIGDFNVDFSDPTAPMYHKLLSIVSSFNLCQVVMEPTQVSSSSSTLIDLIFVSSINLIQSCKTIPALANADHYMDCSLLFLLLCIRDHLHQPTGKSGVTP